MNQLVELMRESDGFIAIEGSTTISPTVEDKMDATYEIIPDFFTLEHSEWESNLSYNEDVTTYKLTFDPTSRILENFTDYPTGTDPTYDMGRYITEFSLEPVDTDFQEADNVIIRLTMEQGGATVEIESQVKMRNKH